MIQLTFTLTTPEVIQLSRSQQLRWIKRLYWILGLLVILIAIQSIITQKWDNFLAICFILALFIGVLEWRLPRKMEHQLNKMPSWGKPITLEFSESHIQQKTANADATVQWQAFTKATELPDWFLLHLGPKALYWSIPKRSFDSLEQMEAFRVLLRSKNLL